MPTEPPLASDMSDETSNDEEHPSDSEAESESTSESESDVPSDSDNESDGANIADIRRVRYPSTDHIEFGKRVRFELDHHTFTDSEDESDYTSSGEGEGE